MDTKLTASCKNSENVFNSLETIETYYIRPSRTIEVILLHNLNRKKLYYIYNYEGSHFLVFDDILPLISSFYNYYQPENEFEDERQLDLYLKNITF